MTRAAQTWRPLRNSYVISAFIDAILIDFRQCCRGGQSDLKPAGGTQRLSDNTRRQGLRGWPVSVVGSSIIGSRTRKTVRPLADSAVTEP